MLHHDEGILCKLRAPCCVSESSTCVLASSLKIVVPPLPPLSLILWPRLTLFHLCLNLLGFSRIDEGFLSVRIFATLKNNNLVSYGYLNLQFYLIHVYILSIYSVSRKKTVAKAVWLSNHCGQKMQSVRWQNHE